jgi:undecaprenyl diphosphate synthase
LTKMPRLFSSREKEQNVVQSHSVATDQMSRSEHPLRHIAIIMDGNGRWATKRHLPRVAGHTAGVGALRRVVQCASDEHIVDMLSVYAFSTENWQRPRIEVEGLMRLFWETVRSDVQRLHRDNVRVRHLGRIYGLPPDVQQAIHEAAELTKNNTGMSVNVCFNYGGRAELVDAVRQMIADGCNPDAIDEELIASYLYTRDLPDPDLVIRTAGEMRISNFLLWQSAYSEYYVTPTLWPDFGRDDLLAAVDSYSQRQRRFGRVKVPTA